MPEELKEDYLNKTENVFNKDNNSHVFLKHIEAIPCDTHLYPQDVVPINKPSLAQELIENSKKSNLAVVHNNPKLQVEEEKKEETDINEVHFEVNEENIESPKENKEIKNHNLHQSDLEIEQFPVHNCERLLTDPEELSAIIPKDAMQFLKEDKDNETIEKVLFEYLMKLIN